jgi:tetratricopeptide (TPR) repeat protein
MTPAALHTSRDHNETISQYLLWAVDLGIVAILFAAPLFMGGRYPLGRFVFVGCACWIAIAWSFRQCLDRRATWHWSGVEWLLLAGLAVLILQLAPLAPDTLQRLSPTIRELLPLWNGGPEATSLGTWNQVSLTPAETRGGLVVYLAYVMMFVVVTQRIRSVEDVERILRWVALAALGMALLGLAQFLFGNGKFLWFYEHPSRHTWGVVKGTFTNQNHFAHFLALGVGPLIWWIQRCSAPVGNVSRDTRNKTSIRSGKSPFVFAETITSRAQHRGLDGRVVRQLLLVALGIVMFAGLLTFSRGGVLALGLAAVVCVTSYFRAGMFGKRALIAVATFAVLVGAALAIFGYEPLVKRLGTLTSSQSVEDACRGRHALWKAHSEAIPKFAILGTGVGSHREVYPIYMSEFFDGEFSHAESGYLHLLLETGFAGTGCMLLGIGIAVTWGLRAFGPRPTSAVEAAISACWGGVASSIAVSAAHSVVDFVWYIPACMSLTVILVACAGRLRQLPTSVPSIPEVLSASSRRRAPSSTARGARTSPHPFAAAGVTEEEHLASTATSGTPRRLMWACAAIAVAAICVAMVQDRLPSALASHHWEDYQKAARQAHGSAMGDVSKTEKALAQYEDLQRTLLVNPHDARANLRIASVLLQQFELAQKTSENPMGLSQIRDAALASQFSSSEALGGWLNVAVGDNRRMLDAALTHAKRAVRLCPLQGEAYVCLAELSFLDPTHSISKSDYITQAEKVRPYEGTVLFAVGSEAALAGDVAKTLAYWKRAFHQDPSVQSMIIQSAAPLLPAELFLSHFQPGLLGLGELYYFYRNTQRQPEAVLTGRYFAEALCRRAETEAESSTAANRLCEAQSVYDFLGDLPQAVACQRRAVAEAPDNYQMRAMLGSLLLRSRQFDEAAEQLQWCLHRQPDDQQVITLLAQVNRDRLAQQPRAVNDSFQRH